MFGTGAPEAVIIILVALLLFGPAVLTFWLGYTMGQKRTEGSKSERDMGRAEVADESSEESADE